MIAAAGTPYSLRALTPLLAPANPRLCCRGALHRKAILKFNLIDYAGRVMPYIAGDGEQNDLK